MIESVHFRSLFSCEKKSSGVIICKISSCFIFVSIFGSLPWKWCVGVANDSFQSTSPRFLSVIIARVRHGHGENQMHLNVQSASGVQGHWIIPVLPQ